MALRILGASSSSLTRQFHRSLPTSSQRYRNVAHSSASTGAHANDGPPTSAVYSRANTPSAIPTTTTTTTTTRNNNNNKIHNPLRLDLSQHAPTETYRIHVACTSNNTHIVISDPHGCPLKAGSWSGGACGFKGVNRSGYEAGYQCAVRAFARVKQLAQDDEGASAAGLAHAPRARFEVLFSGFGQGRDAVFKALMTSEGDDVRPYVLRVTDKTPIKIGGTRAKKTRRL
jgi:small subunit ribosomal protein S11